MADKSTQLLLDALTRAAAEPAGLSLYAQKTEPGLFPSTAAARTAADRAKADGFLQAIDSDAKAREICVLTEKGLKYLVQQASPRQVLEDFVRVLEERKTAIRYLSETVSRMTFGLEAMHAAIAQVLPRLHESHGMSMNRTLTAERSATSDTLIADIKSRLAEWHASVGNSRDCPLPELYQRLDAAGMSVGTFHDALRQLHDDHQIYLHPWTGPLYALPEPAFALMVGHEVAFYASAR